LIKSVLARKNAKTAPKTARGRSKRRQNGLPDRSKTNTRVFGKSKIKRKIPQKRKNEPKTVETNGFTGV
jgi:hypothetical protein